MELRQQLCSLNAAALPRCSGSCRCMRALERCRSVPRDAHQPRECFLAHTVPAGEPTVNQLTITSNRWSHARGTLPAIVARLNRAGAAVGACNLWHQHTTSSGAGSAAELLGHVLPLCASSGQRAGETGGIRARRLTFAVHERSRISRAAACARSSGAKPCRDETKVSRATWPTPVCSKSAADSRDHEAALTSGGGLGRARPWRCQLLLAALAHGVPTRAQQA